MISTTAVAIFVAVVVVSIPGVVSHLFQFLFCYRYSAAYVCFFFLKMEYNFVQQTKAVMCVYSQIAYEVITKNRNVIMFIRTKKINEIFIGCLFYVFVFILFYHSASFIR